MSAAGRPISVVDKSPRFNAVIFVANITHIYFFFKELNTKLRSIENQAKIFVGLVSDSIRFGYIGCIILGKHYNT